MASCAVVMERAWLAGQARLAAVQQGGIERAQAATPVLWPSNVASNEHLPELVDGLLPRRDGLWNVVDDYTCEHLAIEIDASLPGLIVK